MITTAHIAAYIQFLYQQKYQAAAPEEITQSWAQLPAEEIPAQLSALYQHWGLDAAAAQGYEQAFLNQLQQPALVDNFFAPPPSPSQPAPATAPVYSQTSHASYQSGPPLRKSSAWKTVAIVVMLLLLAAGGILAYQLYQNQQPATATSTLVTDTTFEATPPPVEEPEPMVPELPITEADEVNIEAIHQLLAAEDRQDLEVVLSYYAPYMERYRDISYPTQEQLEKSYEANWQKIADAHNEVKDLKKVAPNTYDTQIQFTYYDIKEDKTNTVNSNVRFVFNTDYQITQVYQLK